MKTKTRLFVLIWISSVIYYMPMITIACPPGDDCDEDLCLEWNGSSCVSECIDCEDCVSGYCIDDCPSGQNCCSTGDCEECCNGGDCTGDDYCCADKTCQECCTDNTCDTCQNCKYDQYGDRYCGDPVEVVSISGISGTYCLGEDPITVTAVLSDGGNWPYSDCSVGWGGDVTVTGDSSYPYTEATVTFDTAGSGLQIYAYTQANSYPVYSSTFDVVDPSGDEYPTAEISYSGSSYVPLSTSKYFSGSNSQDNDECGDSIEYYEWWIYDGLNWTCVGYASSCNISFPGTGIWEVWLGVWDDEDDEDWDSVEICVFDVGITSCPGYLTMYDIGQIECEEYGCFGGTFSWSKVSGPSTVHFYSSSSEDPGIEMYITGVYEILVQYSIDGVTASDTCTIIVETPWIVFSPGFICENPCDPSTQIYTDEDELYNEIKVICAKSDGTGGDLGCAYRNFYNNYYISYCMWLWAVNDWAYKETSDESGFDIFSRFKHATAKLYKLNDPLGCLDYYCSKITIVNCLTGSGGIYWRRSTTTNDLTLPTDGFLCPGH